VAASAASAAMAGGGGGGGGSGPAAAATAAAARPGPLVKEEVATPHFAELPYAGGHAGGHYRKPKELHQRQPGVAPECKTCVGFGRFDWIGLVG
jgi:hypothetical protein